MRAGILGLLFTGLMFSQGLILFSPQQNQKTLRAAYGKLPEKTVAWSVVLRGPVSSSIVSQVLVSRGLPVIKNSIIQGYAVKQKRLSWLTIAPQVLTYTGLILGSVADGGTAGVMWPLLGFATSKFVEYIPNQAAAEKVGRLTNDLCPGDTLVTKDRILECIIFTEQSSVPLLYGIEPFQVVIVDPEDEPEVKMEPLMLTHGASIK